MRRERVYIGMVVVALLLVPIFLYAQDSVASCIWSFNLCLYLWLYKHHVERRR